MTPSIWQILIVLVLVLLLFGGRGKISSVMGDMARGIRSFKTGLKDDEDERQAEAPRSIPDKGETIDVAPSKEKTEA